MVCHRFDWHPTAIPQSKKGEEKGRETEGKGKRRRRKGEREREEGIQGKDVPFDVLAYILFSCEERANNYLFNAY